MRLVRFALLAAVIWAVAGASSVQAQFVPVFKQGVTGPFIPPTPVGGFGVNGFRFVSNVNLNLNIRNGPFSFNWSIQDTRVIRSPFPVWTNSWFGYNPFLYPSLYGGNAYNNNNLVGGFDRAPVGLPVNPVNNQDNRGQGVFNQWQWEREQGPSLEERRQQLAREQLERTLDRPAAADVASGAALNAIRTAIDALGGKTKDVEPIALPDDVMRRIQFTKAGGGSASPALLGDEGRITWPRPLVGLTSIAELREKVEKRFSEAFQQADKGKQVDRVVVKDLEQLSSELADAVAGSVAKLGFDDHREAKRFLKSLDDAVVLLKQADASKWLPGRVNITAKTVQELLKAMNDKGARFAPAAPGAEQQYFALHQALADYYRKAAPDDVAAKQ